MYRLTLFIIANLLLCCSLVRAETQGEPANAGSDIQTCADSLRLAGNTPTTFSGQWNIISGSGSLINSNQPDADLVQLQPGLTTLVWEFFDGLDLISSDTLIITVNEPPSAALAGDDQTLCSTNAQLSATEPTNGTGTWSSSNPAVTFSDANAAISTASNLSTGSNTLVWTVAVAGCEPNSDTLIITVNEPPSAALAGDDQTLCSTNAQLSATEPANGTGTWSSSNPAVTFSDANAAISTASNLSTGSNTLVWTVAVAGCEPNSDTLIITVNEAPSAALAGDDQSLCSTNAQLSATEPANGTGTWSSSNPAVTFSDANAAISTASNLSTGPNTLVWTVAVAGCEPNSDTLIITVNEPPSAALAGDDQTLCSTNAQLSATEPANGTGTWSSSNPAVTFSDANAAISTASNLSTGPNTLVWTVAVAGCEPNSDTLIITVNEPPSAALAGDDQTLCSTSTTLAANNPTIGVGTWSVISGSGTFSNANLANATVSGMTPGLNVFRWTVSNPPCTDSFDEVSIVVDNNPVSPNAGEDQFICSNTSTLDADPAVGGFWTVVSGLAVLQDANQADTEVSGLSTGENTFRWTIPGGSCGDVFDEISIFVDTPPGTAFAGNDTNICSTSFQLSASTPIVGIGTWSVISGNAVFSNPNSPNTTISQLDEGENILRWTLSNGVCSPQFDEINITVSISNLVAEAGPDQDICTANTILSATPATGGIWSLVSGNADIQNPQLANTAVNNLSPGTTILRWTVPNGICGESSDTISITVQAPPTTANAGNDQQLCSTVAQLNANPALSGTGQWSIVSGAATFANPALFNTSVSGLNPGNTVLRWTISNGNCPPSFDDVTLNVSSNPVSPDAGPDQTICGSSTNLAATSASGGSWSLISGSGTLANPSQANTAVSGLGTGANVFRWTIDGGACGEVFDEVSINVDEAPSAAQAGEDQTVCGSNTNLNATTPLVGTGLWSVQSGSAVFANASQANSTVSGLATGVNTLVWTVSNGVCPPSADVVTITVQAAGATASAGPDQIICASQTLLAATPATGGAWSVLNGNAQIANPQQANSLVTGLIPGEYTFRWTVPDGVCGSVFDDVQVTVQPNPSPANAGTDQTICSTNATLAANTPVVGSGQWSVISGSATFANAGLPNTTVSGLSPGTNVLRWTISNGVCAPSADEVTIQVSNNPVSPSAGPDQQICALSTVLTASPTGAGLWTTIEGSGTFANPTNSTTAVIGLSAGTNVFRWTIDAGACGTAFDEVEITVSQSPGPANAGNDQTICNTSTSLNAQSNFVGAGLWSVISGSGNFAAANSPQTNVNGLSPGLNVFQWTVTNGVCPAQSDQVSILVETPPSSVNAGPDQQICGTSTSLNASPANNGTWTIISGSATLANPNSATSSVSGLGSGQTILRWTVSTGTCSPVSDEVTITVITPPTAAQAGADQILCTTNANLNANSPIVGIGQWSVISGTASFSNAGSPTSAVSGLSPGQNILRWTISNGSCLPSQDDLTITVQSQPSAANAGVDQQVCGSNATMAANTPLVGNGQWTVVSGSGVFSNPGSPTTTVSNLSAGLNIFRWTIINGFCPASTDEVNIISFSTPTAAQAGPDASLCGNSTALGANTPIVGFGLWTVISGNATFSNPAIPNATVSGLQTGNTVLRWTISNGVCPPSQDEITLTVLPTPQASAGNDQQVCSPSASLSANTPGSGNTGNWTIVSGSASLSNPGSPTSQVSNLTIGTTVLQWTVSNAQCPSASDQVSITRFAEPSTAQAGPNQQTCATSANLNAQAPTIGNGFWSVLSGSGSIAAPGQSTTTISGLNSGQNQLLWTVSNGVCAPSTDTLIITVDANPTNASAGADQQVCAASASLNATAPTAGSGLWTILSGSGNIATPTLANTTINGLSAGITTLRWTVTNGSCVSFDDVQITRFLPPTTSNAGSDLVVCAVSGQLNANVPNTGSGIWTVISGSGTFNNASAANTGVSGLSPGANVFQWTISNGPCPTSGDQVSLFRETPPSPAIAGPDTMICGSTIALNAIEPLVGNGIWSIVSGGGTLSNPQSASTNLSNLNAGANILLWTTINGNCPASVDTLVVERFLPPSVANAGNDVITCDNAIALQAEAPLSGNGTWSLIAGSGSIANPGSAQSAFNNVQPGLNFLVWTVSSGPCTASTDQIIIERLEAPVQAQVGNDLELCALEVELTGNDPGDDLAAWSILSGNGQLSNTQGISNTLSAIQNDTLLLSYTISNAACSTSDTLSVILWQPISTPNAGADTLLCGPELLLNGTADEFAQTNWSVVSGIAGINNPSLLNSLVNISLSGDVLLQLNASNGTCPVLSDTLQITRVVLSDTAEILSENQVVCDDTLSLLASPNNGTWQLIAGSAVLSSTNQPSILLSNMEEGEITLIYRYSEGECSNTDTLVLLKSAFPTNVNAGFDRVICGTEFQLEALQPDNGSGEWTIISGNGLLADNTDANSLFTRPEQGLSRLVWTVSNAFCSKSDTLTLNFFEIPEADAGPDIIGCLGEPLFLQAEIPAIGIATWSSLSAGMSILEPGFQNSGIEGASTGNYFLQWKVINGACSDSDLVVITLLSPEDPACKAKEPEVFIPEGFSPNEDGLFDRLVIQQPPGKRVSLRVFDRWGNKVYESTDYQNNWDGKANAGLVIGADLPESTYYYLVEIEGENQQRRGYLTLWR
jgi:gliding motility-associated-like protein